MNLNRLKLGAALAVISVLVFGNIAQAATTIDVVSSGTSTSASTIANGDSIDVTDSATIPVVGAATSELNSGWNSDALRLLTGSSVTYPEGWNLQYTTDGTTWSGTAPAPLSNAVGIRSIGSIDTVDGGFRTHPSSQLLQSAGSFTGSTGGDGYDLTFVDDRVYNQFHHSTSIQLQCHLKATGNSCAGLTVAGYQTPNGASSFYSASTKKLYVVSMRTSGHDYGFVCINLANLSAPAVCATPFVMLYDGNGSTDGYREYIGSSSQDATNRVWVFNGANYSLMCLNLLTGAACATGNGQVLPNTGVNMVGPTIANSGRVSAIEGKVYYVTDTKFGCYDPTAAALCGVGRTVAAANQYPPFPIRSSSGTLTGVCLYVTKVCISDTETNVALPSGDLTTQVNIAMAAWNTYNAGQWAEVDNKLYLNTGPAVAPSGASNSVYCYDFTTGADCSGFSGANVGSEIYAIIADPAMPSCLWTNGNAGVITSFSGISGTRGCSTPNPVARMPYSAVAPRMSCSESGRVTSWTSVHFNFGAQSAVTRSNLRVTVYNASGTSLVAIPGFNGVTIDNTDTLDLSSINTVTYGTRATIEITGGVGPTNSELLMVTADVIYQAAAPQLCFTLMAKEVCANGYVHQPGDLSVADGVIHSASVVTPVTGSVTTETSTQTLGGTYTNTVCIAVGGSSVPGPPSAPIPKIGLTKTQISADPTFPGDVVKYTLVATNTGPVAIHGVSITDANASVSDCNLPGNSVTLAIGQQLTCMASHVATLAEILAGYVVNTANVSVSEEQISAASNTVTTKVTNAPALAVTKKQTSAAPKLVGDVIRYEIRATNTGNTNLSNVEVVDRNADTVTCDVAIPAAHLAIGASIVCEATHKVTDADVKAGKFVNIAIAKSDDVTASSDATTNAPGQTSSNAVSTSLVGVKTHAASVKGGGSTSATKGGTTGSAAKPGTSGKPTGNLAFTGASESHTGLIGLLLILLGAGFLGMQRRKRFN
jgi:hypothetical protein